jgi:hypothetical protein
MRRTGWLKFAERLVVEGSSRRADGTQVWRHPPNSPRAAEEIYVSEPGLAPIYQHYSPDTGTGTVAQLTLFGNNGEQDVYNYAVVRHDLKMQIVYKLPCQWNVQLIGSGLCLYPVKVRLSISRNPLMGCFRAFIATTEGRRSG